LADSAAKFQTVAKQSYNQWVSFVAALVGLLPNSTEHEQRFRSWAQLFVGAPCIDASDASQAAPLGVPSNEPGSSSAECSNSKSSTKAGDCPDAAAIFNAGQPEVSFEHCILDALEQHLMSVSSIVGDPKKQGRSSSQSSPAPPQGSQLALMKSISPQLHAKALGVAVAALLAKDGQGLEAAIECVRSFCGERAE